MKTGNVTSSSFQSTLTLIRERSRSFQFQKHFLKIECFIPGDRSATMITIERSFLTNCNFLSKLDSQKVKSTVFSNYTEKYLYRL
jgi:hypothetical protein